MAKAVKKAAAKKPEAVEEMIEVKAEVKEVIEKIENPEKAVKVYLGKSPVTKEELYAFI